MTDVSDLTDVRDETARFFAWLANDALPLWSTAGVDWRDGGFIERLTPAGQVIADVRRARVVARHIFAFKSAGDLGWKGPVDRILQHGLVALLGRHLTAEGDVLPRYVPATDRTEGEFDLYDQAFMLFGLAHGYAHTNDSALERTALSILAKMRAKWSRAPRGFAETNPATAPLKANPHMHLLEASLAWMEVSADPAWPELAAEIVDLCLTSFIDASNGALHEYFDIDWSVLEGSEDVIEPGHQAEWAWLLTRWNAINPTERLTTAATRLLAIAEGVGLNRSQHCLINELDADLSPRDTRLRLWPQTERIKALVAFRGIEPQTEDPRDLSQRLAEAVNALFHYFDHPIAGSWWEHLDTDGKPMLEPARASSLYHIMGAANELARLTGLGLD